jgi:hypothetical protein
MYRVSLTIQRRYGNIGECILVASCIFMSILTINRCMKTYQVFMVTSRTEHRLSLSLNMAFSLTQVSHIILMMQYNTPLTK